MKMLKEATCTSKPCAWLQPTPANAKGVSPAEIASIEFISPSARHKMMTCSPFATPPSPSTSSVLPFILIPTQEEAASFYQSLWDRNEKRAILSVLPGYSEHFIPTAGRLPKNILRNLFDTNNLNEAYSKLLVQSESLYRELSHKHLIQDIQIIEAHTKAQSRSSAWFDHRSCRITASTLKAVCRTSIEKPSISLLKRICYPEDTQFSTAATK